MLVLVACVGSPPESPPPDILVVVLDTVRRDRTTPYGYARRTSPQLDAVAEHGVVYERAEAASPWTYPSHATLLTGLEPWEHGAHQWPQGDSVVVREPNAEVSMLAEELSASGYRTILGYANPWLASGLDRGFEATFHSPNDDAVVEWVGQQLAVDDPRPVFVFVNLMVAHALYEVFPVPWLTPAHGRGEWPDWAAPFAMTSRPGLDTYRPYKEVHDHVYEHVNTGAIALPPEAFALLSDVYDAGVMWVDWTLNLLLQQWNGSGRQAGLVIVTSDHGELLGEGGQLDHGRSTQPAVLDVPLVVAWPGHLEPGRISAPVGHSQIAPTIRRASGLEPDAVGALPGLGGDERTVFAAAYPNGRALGREHDIKTIRVQQGDDVLVNTAAKSQLFDLAADPGMEHDRAGDDPERLADLEALLPTVEVAGGRIVEPDEERAAALRALGYLD